MIYKLLQTGEIATKRDLYYEEPQVGKVKYPCEADQLLIIVTKIYSQLFRSQAVVDRIVDDIACMLDVPRCWLNVVATSKGCLAGNLKFSGPDDETIDCSQVSGVSLFCKQHILVCFLIRLWVTSFIFFRLEPSMMYMCAGCLDPFSHWHGWWNKEWYCQVYSSCWKRCNFSKAARWWLCNNHAVHFGYSKAVCVIMLCKGNILIIMTTKSCNIYKVQG